MAVLIHEHCLGIDEMVDDLKKSYRESCKHRGVEENNMEYFQEYIFVMIAIIMKKQQEMEIE